MYRILTLHTHFLSGINRILLLILSVVLCVSTFGEDAEVASSSPALDQPEGYLIFINGDTLSARIKGKEQSSSTLTVSSPFLQNIADFNINQINALYLPGKHSPITSNIELYLNNKDYIRGSLLKVDEQNIRIKTPWSNVLNIKRSLVEGFTITPLSKILFDGTQNSAEWSHSNSKQKGSLPWKISFNNFYTNKQGGICSPILTEKKIRLSFYFLPTDYSMVPFILWRKAPGDASEEYSYTFTFRPNAVNARKTLKNKTAYDKSFRLSELGTPTYVAGQKPQAIRFDLFIDRDEDKIFLYADSLLKSDVSDGEVIDININPEEEANNRNTTSTVDDGKFGTYLYFTNASSNQAPILITQLAVKKWNGVFPGKELLDVPVRTKDIALSKPITPWEQENNNSSTLPNTSANKTNPQLQLVNGDIVNSLIPSGKVDHLTLKTPLYSTDISLDKIMGARFAPTKDRQRFSKDDIRVYLTDNSIITLRFLHADEKGIHGSSESVGKISIDIPQIKRVDFNLYNDSLKKLRAKESQSSLYFPQ